MKNRQTKAWCCFLAIVMSLAILPVSNVYASADPIYINGIDITKASQNTVSCGSGTAVYDSATQAVVLTNATLNAANERFRIIDIGPDSPLTITLVGDSKIVGSSTSVPMYSESDITIKGEGSLVVNSETVWGIATEKELIIDGANIDVGVTEDGAIYAGGKITIKNDSAVVSKGRYYGLQADNGMTVSNSMVTAESSEANCNAIYIPDGLLSISEDAYLHATSKYPALWAKTGIAIEDSVVSATSSTDMGIWTPASLSITGNSSITATGALGSLGAGTTATITPPTNKKVEVVVGDNKESAQIVENSPFSTETDISSYKNEKYFYSKIYDKYTVTVNNGSGAGDYAKGDTVTVIADAPSTGKHFNEWVVLLGDVTLANSKNETTTFVMPEEEVEITATYEDITHTHTPSSTWSKDAANHWHECTANDGEKMDLASHTFGDWVVDTSATETTEGSKRRDCSVCGYSDTAEIPATGEAPTPEVPTPEKPTPEAPTPEKPTPEVPTITIGGEFTYQISAGKDITLTCSGKLEDLEGVYVDGKLVNARHYTLKSGSTVLTLKARYLDTLSVGKHTLKFQYKNNVSAETEFTITTKASKTLANQSSPRTGDTSNTLLYLGLIALSGGVAVFGLKKNRALNK